MASSSRIDPSTAAEIDRLATAGTRYLAKLTRSNPGLNLSDIADTLRSIKPGLYRRDRMG